MRCEHVLVVLVWLALISGGCGKPQVDDQAPAPDAGVGPATTQGGGNAGTQLEGPAIATREFLEAVRSGNDEKAAQMLTVAAREKTTKMDLKVAPPGSDTAEFSIGKVQYFPQDRAGVHCVWSDLDENSRRKVEKMIWMLRREPSGWRVAGVVVPVFEDRPPLLLNFEDPEDMVRKQQWARQEALRRAQKANPAVRSTENPANSTLR